MERGYSTAVARASVGYLKLGRWALALWLMVGYVVPQTAWERVSFHALAWRFLPNAQPGLTLALAGVLFGGAWLSFARLASQERWAQLLWLLMGAYASGYLVDPLGRGYSGVGYLRCAFVLVSLATGLVCARLLSGRELMVCVVLLVGLQAGYAMWYFGSGKGVFFTHNVARAGGTFGTPVHVYTLMLIALPMNLSLVREAKSAGWRVLLWSSSVLMMAMLWLTYSRSAWLALSVVLTLAVRAMWNRPRLVIAVAAAMAVLFAVMYGWRLGGSVGMGDTTAEARLDIWRKGWQVFRENWLWGVGADNVRIRYTSTWRGYAVSTWYGAPENQVLLWMCEHGIWGGVLAGLLAVATWQRLRSLSATRRWGLGGALLAIGILGMFQSVFGRLEEGVETVLVTAVWASLLREEVN